MIENIDFLSKGEVPIQFYEPTMESWVAVPINPRILKLDDKLLSDCEIAQESLGRALVKYDDDVERHKRFLPMYIVRAQKFQGYHEIKKKWEFKLRKGDSGLFSLVLYSDGRETTFKVPMLPVRFETCVDKDGNPNYAALNPEALSEGVFIELKNKPNRQNTIRFSARKAIRYQIKGSSFNVGDGGVIHADFYAYASECLDSLGKAILFRNFAVIYHNELLRRALKKSGKDSRPDEHGRVAFAA